MAAILRVLGDKGPSDRFVLPLDRPVVIGRGEGCELCIDDRSLSRLHCVIELESGAWRVADCNSTNGTRVAGFRISETRIQPGEVIQIGDVRIEFSVDESGDVPALVDSKGSDYALAGRYFSRFELLRLVHAGPSGTVYMARENEKNREVALKMLGRDLMVDEATRKRFERGVRAAAPLAHPGIVQLYATGKTEGQAWLSMEWVDGPSVRDLLQREQKLETAEAVRIIQGLASAVQSIASQGIVHRNIKPSSILITPSGEPKLGDFVLARSVHEGPADRITRTGAIVGDSEYLAPECFHDPSAADSRADIYSLGACLYAMLTGHPPFPEANISRLMQRVLHDAVPPPSRFRPQIPRELECVILRCLAKDPGDRFETPQQLFESLDALGDLDPTPVPDQDSSARHEASPTILKDAPSESAISSVYDDPVSLPSSATQSTGTWRRFLIIPKPTNTPSEHPWSTLFVTIVAVVGIGSLLLFGGKLRFDHSGDGSADSGGLTVDSEKKPPIDSAGTGPTGATQRPADSAPAKSKPLVAALADPERLIVQPGTPLRNISEAIELAQDGQVIEVASNDMFRGEIKLTAKSLTLVANPEFHPAIRNTLRINGGSTIRIEGFHFEPYLANKPAIEVEKMPEKLELAGCTFRGTDGVLIAVRSTAAPLNKRPQLVLERSFAVGNIALGLAGLPPDLRLTHSCLVVDQSVVDWQLSPGDVSAPAGWNMVLRNNTLVGRNMFHVTLDDQQRRISQLPRTTIRLDDNIFAFPPRYPCTFFRWEASQRPDIVRDRFVWSGSNNAFSGLGPWSMATTLVLSDPGATPQVVIDSPDDWQSQWAQQVSNILKVPPDFHYTGPSKKIGEVTPSDYELTSQSKLRELGSDKRPLGADIRSLPAPPPVP